MAFLKAKLVFGEEPCNYLDAAHIMLCADKNVLRGFGVEVVSILENNSYPIVFHLFFNGELPDRERERIEQLVACYHCCIEVCWIDDTCLKKLHHREDISITSYYRFLAPYVLAKAGLNRCLYLDTDMLCVGDLVILFDMDLGNKVAYVVQDASSMTKQWQQHCKDIGMQGIQYFNSGMLLVNTFKYVSEDFGMRAVELATANDFEFMDQDVLNILLEDKVIFETNPKFNSIMRLKDKDFDKDVRIVHFTGKRKPWKQYTCVWGEKNAQPFAWKNAYYKLWRQYFMQSPWQDEAYDKPVKASEWRYMGNAYRWQGQYWQAFCAYIKWVQLKI